MAAAVLSTELYHIKHVRLGMEVYLGFRDKNTAYVFANYLFIERHHHDRFTSL